MAYWLFKSEPGTWSWNDHVKKGVEHWDGVRNYQANNNMKAMKVGDLGFFYHSVNEKKIVGVVEVVSDHYPDHTDKTGRFGMVDLKAVKQVTTPVTLSQIKANPKLSDMVLVKNSRLSVQPVSKSEWNEVCRMVGI
ncbi:MAG: EVE domain-containing protein [Alphaproteobacteria bacterium]|nr:EVE domain-containing protein [Alphaproteobacteria bacterium]